MRAATRWLAVGALVLTLAACKGDVTSGVVVDVQDADIGGTIYVMVQVRDTTGKTGWITLQSDHAQVHCKVGAHYPECSR